MSAVNKLAKLSEREREMLDPFPSISPQTGIAERVKFTNPFTGEYILAEPYNRIYHEKSTIFIDISKVFAQKRGARGTLLVGPKASGKTHLLAIEAHYIKSRYNGKLIMVNDKEYKEYVELADARIKLDEVREENSIIKAICKKLSAKGNDIDALRNALNERGWEAVQLIVDDIYEPLWSQGEIAREIFELFKLHTVSKPPIIRTSVAIHTGERASAADFFELNKETLNMLIASYESGEEFTKRIVNAMFNHEVIPGATVVPVVTEWHLYVDESDIEIAFRDFFNKYILTVEDPELRNLRLEDLVDESYVMETAIKAAKWGVYRVFARESSVIWRTFRGEKLRGDEKYVAVLEKYRELAKRRDEEERSQRLHRFYKEILENAVSRIMELRGCKLSKTRRYIIDGGKVRWRTIEYYVTPKGEELVIIIPPLAYRKTGVVVERPNEVAEKISDVRAMMPSAHIIGIITEDADDRGLRGALGKGNYALIKLPSPRKDSAIKYFYAPLYSGVIDDEWLRYLLEKYVEYSPGSALQTVRLFKSL